MAPAHRNAKDDVNRRKSNGWASFSQSLPAAFFNGGCEGHLVEVRPPSTPVSPPTPPHCLKKNGTLVYTGSKISRTPSISSTANAPGLAIRQSTPNECPQVNPAPKQISGSTNESDRPTGYVRKSSRRLKTRLSSTSPPFQTFVGPTAVCGQVGAPDRSLSSLPERICCGHHHRLRKLGG